MAGLKNLRKNIDTIFRTDNFKKKAVFVCTFRADRGKNGQNAHIKSMKKPFSYVQMRQDFEKSFEKALVVHLRGNP